VIRLTNAERETAGRAILDKSLREHAMIVAIAVASTHVHVLLRTDGAEIALPPSNSSATLPTRSARPSPAAPGRPAGTLVSIKDRKHHLTVYQSILKHGPKDGA